MPEEGDRVLRAVNAATSLIHVPPGWSRAQERDCIWILAMVNSSLREGIVPLSLKKASSRDHL